MLYSGIHYVVVAAILLRENSIKSAAALINLVIFYRKSYVLRGFQALFFILFSKSVELCNICRVWVNYAHFYKYFLNFLKVQNTQFWANITGKAHVADPGIEHEPRRFFDAFWREIKTAKIQDSRTSVFVRKHVISKFEIVSSDAVYHIFMQISSLKLCRSM